jgi:hypothetical protein
MLTGNTFHISFSCALADNITVKLKATVTCNYVKPCYVITGLQIINNTIATCFENEIKIRPVIHDDHINWLHINSLRTSILSTAIGKAIEARGYLEILRRSEVAA